MTKELESLLNRLDFIERAYAFNLAGLAKLAGDAARTGRNVTYALTDNRDGKPVVTWTASPAEFAVNRDNFAGFVAAASHCSSISDLDFFFSSCIVNHLGGKKPRGGNSWGEFQRLSNIDLLAMTNGPVVYELVQKRHVIEHNAAIVDAGFIGRLKKHGMQTAAEIGQKLGERRIGPVLMLRAIADFAKDLDREMTRVLKERSN